MTEYVRIDRELIGKVSASLHDYKDGAEWGAFDLSALVELDDILAAPQQAAEPVGNCEAEFEKYWADFCFSSWGSNPHPDWPHNRTKENMPPQWNCIHKSSALAAWQACWSMAGHPPAQPEQRAARTQIPDGVTRVRNAATGEVVWEQPAPIPTGRTHELKTDPTVFDAVLSRRKTFEIRYNDRDYHTGDTLILRRTRYTGDEMLSGAPLIYVGNPLPVTVTYMMHGPAYGWVIMGIAPAPPAPRPVPTCERLPTEADADYSGAVFAFTAFTKEWVLQHWAHVADCPNAYLYWQKTGLTRPAAPDSGGVL